MAHTLTNLLTHVVFSTHERTPLITDAIRADLHAYLGGILRELHATPIAIRGTADHVHLLTLLPGNLAVADCLSILKTNSSRWVKEKGRSDGSSHGRAAMPRSASASPVGRM